MIGVIFQVAKLQQSGIICDNSDTMNKGIVLPTRSLHNGRM